MTTPEERRLVRAMSIAAHRAGLTRHRRIPMSAFRAAYNKHLPTMTKLVENCEDTPELLAVIDRVLREIAQGKVTL